MTSQSFVAILGHSFATEGLQEWYIPNWTGSSHVVNSDQPWDYDGYFHIHLADNPAMTEREHTDNSQDLYYTTGKPTKNTGVPYGVIEQKKQRKIQARKSLRKNRRR